MDKKRSLIEGAESKVGLKVQFFEPGQRKSATVLGPLISNVQSGSISLAVTHHIGDSQLKLCIAMHTYMGLLLKIAGPHFEWNVVSECAQVSELGKRLLLCADLFEEYLERRVPLGCKIHCPRVCICVVMVNSSSFSGRRLPFFSTILPIEMRPKTGGVIIKPLIMFAPKKQKPQWLCQRGKEVEEEGWREMGKAGVRIKRALRKNRLCLVYTETSGTWTSSEIAFGHLRVIFGKLSRIEDLAVFAASPRHNAATCKAGLTSFTHVHLYGLAQTSFVFLCCIELFPRCNELIERGTEHWVIAHRPS